MNEEFLILDASIILELLESPSISNNDLQLEIVNISHVEEILSDVEIPIKDAISTLRSLCSNSSSNQQVLSRLEAAFNPLNVTECSSDIFNIEFSTINSLDELKRVLSELLIRFDTNPLNYLKSDFDYLISVIYKTLIRLYENTSLNIITTTWNSPLRNDLVPSEKLVKETIDSIVNTGYLTEETDPTVPDWAKLENKPTYTALEVGALPDDTVIPEIPTNVSAFTNDAGYLTQHLDVSGKEDKSNKVTTFQSLPDDTHYPSEKLVKDNLNQLLGLIAICL